MAAPELSTESLDLFHATPSDIPAIVHCFTTAFSVTPLDQLTFPNGVSPEALAYMVEREHKAFPKDTSSATRVMVVKERVTGEVVGLARWECRNGEEKVIEKDVVSASTPLPSSSPSASASPSSSSSSPPQTVQPTSPPKGFNPPGARVEAMNAFMAEHEKARDRLLDKKRKFWYLRMLATLPMHQRKGIGALAMRWGVEQAERDKVDMFLFATPVGKGLYEKFGFETIEEIHFDLTPFGREFMNVTYAMLRKGSSSNEGLVV